MEQFADRLTTLIRRRNSCSVVGLDPHWPLIPETVKASSFKKLGRNPAACADAVRRFCVELVDAVAAHVPAVKPQSACFEQFGPPGVEALAAVMEHARSKGLIVIADVKRGDIGSTAECYARAYLGGSDFSGVAVTAFPADAATVNPYLGSDSIIPFVEQAAAKGKGVFVLVKTSNPSSAEIQDVPVDGEPLYMKIGARLAATAEKYLGASGYSLLGAVAGATFASAGAKIRALLPRSYILVPGYGAQGAGAADIKAFFNPDGLGAIVNSSRAIAFAWRDEPYASKFGEARWQEASEAAIVAMNLEIRAHAPHIKGADK